MSEWQKVKLSDICNFVKGETGIAKADAGEYPLVVTGKERKTCDSFQLDCKAVCIPLVSSSGHGKASLNYVHYQEGKFALGSI
jgi:type I restriction enzyme S subunit